jgi:hypothetical protein
MASRDVYWSPTSPRCIGSTWGGHKRQPKRNPPHHSAPPFTVASFIQNINTHTRTHKIRAQSTQTNRDTEASSKASGERQPLPIIRESGAPCQRPAQTAGDRGGAPCSLPYSGGNNPRDSASKQASAHHNSRATSTRTATHAYHHHTTHAGCQSTGVGWPTRVNPHGRKKTRAQTARARPKPEVKRRGKPDRESGHVGTGGTLAAMRRGLDRERLEPT